MKKPKSSVIGLSIVFCLIAVSPGEADLNQMIQDGIVYLEANQDEATGFWGMDKETPHRDGTVAVDVLGRLEANYNVDPDVLEHGFGRES
jgi:hypothetical protein